MLARRLARSLTVAALALATMGGVAAPALAAKPEPIAINCTKAPHAHWQLVRVTVVSSVPTLLPTTPQVYTRSEWRKLDPASRPVTGRWVGVFYCDKGHRSR